MNKYINADELIDEIIFNEEDVGIIGSKEAIDIIQNMPSADVVEVKHGEWIDEEVDCGGIYGGIATEVITYCSECEEQCEYRTYFCPNCGADMRERKETNE